MTRAMAYGHSLPGLQDTKLPGKLIVVEGTDGVGRSTQIALLRHEHHLAIGIVEMLIDHRFGDEEDVRGHAGLGVDVARRGHGLHALQERHPS